MLTARLQREFDAQPRRTLASVLQTLLPQRFAALFPELAGVDGEKTCATVSRGERMRLQSLLQSLPLMISRRRPLSEAIVTRGGVAVKEVDPATMQSRLMPGLYLVSGRPVEILPWAYTFTPFMVSIPTRDMEDQWLYDVLSDVKLEKTPARTDIDVVKLWDDLGYEDRRPGSIYVDLYCDGEQIAAAQLHDGNSWSYTFTDLPAAHEYTVMERDVPDWYQVSYEVINGVLVIRNTRDTTVTPVPDIPSTGQLWWPVPILAGLGMLLCIAGWFIQRKWSQEHE